MTQPPIKTAGLRVRVRVDPVLRQAVEHGVAWGLAKAYERDENPGESKIKEIIIERVLISISESFAIDEDTDK